MEFVLKHDRFCHLRELDYSPVVLCPSRTGALALVKSIVTQVMEAQPGANFLHIGADEVGTLALSSGSFYDRFFL